jgi:dipeptidase E
MARSVKFLLTSGGVNNASIHAALVGLLGKPVAEASALFIPTALHAIPNGAFQVYQDISGAAESRFCGLGWGALGVLELTALPSLKAERWVPLVQAADALLVGGGDPLYLCYWLRQSGLAALLPTLRPAAVYVGLSAGSMVAAPDFGAVTYGGIGLSPEDTSGLGLVDFAVFPHLDYPSFPRNTLAHAAQWAGARTVPTYAIDDETAIQVVDGGVEVVSEGHWQRFEP